MLFEANGGVPVVAIASACAYRPRSKSSPNPPRIAVDPSPLTSQANPNRGLKLSNVSNRPGDFASSQHHTPKNAPTAVPAAATPASVGAGVWHTDLLRFDGLANTGAAVVRATSTGWTR